MTPGERLTDALVERADEIPGVQLDLGGGRSIWIHTQSDVITWLERLGCEGHTGCLPCAEGRPAFDHNEGDS